MAGLILTSTKRSDRFRLSTYGARNPQRTAADRLSQLNTKGAHPAALALQPFVVLQDKPITGPINAAEAAARDKLIASGATFDDVCPTLFTYPLGQTPRI
jgi:hypothetical protein